jgi:hypothetical protein
MEWFVYAVTRTPRIDDAGSLDDLVADCRDIAPGVFPRTRRIIDLSRQVPAPRVPTQDPAHRKVIVIRDSVVSLVEGYSEYGS